jgi:hypothetical protein
MPDSPGRTLTLRNVGRGPQKRNGDRKIGSSRILALGFGMTYPRNSKECMAPKFGLRTTQITIILYCATLTDGNKRQYRR